MVYTVDPDLIACNGLAYDEYGLDVGRLNDLSYVSSRSYMQQLKGDLPFLDIPRYSYYAVVVKTEAGQAQAYSWSLHKMAEEAGVPIHLVHKWCRQYM